ncbi:MAG TPA: PhzF family phenazine biosynthesis protein [Thermoanaerobaculia bacterium]|nr:PhzF family phenazine biosynthesis protein [Thermoanaerobaculia bacterium]
MSSPRQYRYRVVDVFTTRQLEGNPLAVFPSAAGLDPSTMQRIARELNLAETVFVLPPSNGQCAARLKIFTPVREMEFAGHPTVGAAFVLLNERLATPDNGRFALEENVGHVPVRVDGGNPPMLWLTTPPIREEGLFDRSVCAQALGLSESDLLDITPQLLDAGNPTLLVALRNKEAVDRAWVDTRATETLREPGSKPLCLFVFTPTTDGAYSRMFAPGYGVTEDPATGSSTGPLALFMMRHGLVSSRDGTRFVSEQGTKMGRRSILHVNVKGEMGRDGIEVGGNVTPLTEASMTLEE